MSTEPLFLTLCAEGTTDVMLVPVVKWALRRYLGPALPIAPRLEPMAAKLTKRIPAALRSAGKCDLLVIHRDADRAANHAARLAEIDAAVAELSQQSISLPPVVRVVPVRCSEAWLLFDEDAIRRASGAPSERMPLNLPRRGFDMIAAPKEVLNDAILAASGRAGRRRGKLQRDIRPIAVAEQIDDFSPLLQLPAFAAFDAEVAAFAAAWLAAHQDGA